jgi:hypothetical protein
MSLIHLELLVPVVQLILEVVDIVLGDNQLILSVLQLCTGIIKEVGLDVTAVVRPHQLIIQLFDTHLKVVVLLEELSVFLLDVFDEVGLGVHLVIILLHASVLVGASHRDLLKHGAHVLGVACRERPTRVVSRTLRGTYGNQVLTPCYAALVSNGEQGNSGAVKARQVALTKLHEGLVGSPLQSVIEVVARSCDEPNSHARVRRVSWDIHMDLATSMPELTVQEATVCGSRCVVKAVQHISEQGREAGTVQPVATKPSVRSEGGVGVVSIYQKQGRNESTFPLSNRDNKQNSA